MRCHVFSGCLSDANPHGDLAHEAAISFVDTVMGLMDAVLARCAHHLQLQRTDEAALSVSADLPRTLQARLATRRLRELFLHCEVKLRRALAGQQVSACGAVRSARRLLTTPFALQDVLVYADDTNLFDGAEWTPLPVGPFVVSFVDAVYRQGLLPIRSLLTKGAPSHCVLAGMWASSPLLQGLFRAFCPQVRAVLRPYCHAPTWCGCRSTFSWMKAGGLRGARFFGALAFFRRLPTCDSEVDWFVFI